MVAKRLREGGYGRPDRQGQPVHAAPLLEFSGSCAGCAETAYARLITQLFGDRMYISNATGCSSIWGGPAATSPYTVNAEGKGPAWANSLFEDNAEHGLGLYLGQKAIRNRLAAKTEALIAVDWARPELKEAAQKWLDTMEDGQANQEAAKAYVAALEAGLCTVDELLASRQGRDPGLRQGAAGQGRDAVSVRGLQAGQGDPGREGVPEQEVRVDLRRRRLGLRHRLRRRGPCAGLRRGCEHLRL